MAKEYKLTTIEYIRSTLCAVWFIVVLCLVFVTAIPLFIITFGMLRDWINTNFGYIIGRSCLFVLGVGLRIDYQPQGKPDQPAVYIINHSSTLDLFVLLSLRIPKIRFVAKKEFQYNPLFLILGNLTDHIFIDRSSSKASIETIRAAVRKVKRNKLSVLFAPEGSRNHPGIIGPFKRGAFHMAVDLEYPIHPIYFDGAKNLCPGGSILSKTGVIHVTFHNRIDTSEWTEATLGNHINEVRNKYLEWAEVADKSYQTSS